MMSQINNNFNSSSNDPTAMFADCLANSKEIIQLIDEVFPIDSCQQYEVLPLKLTGNNLALGMLDPQNEESLKFVNSIARVFKYNLEIQSIDLQTLQIILASYPQDSSQPKQKQDYNQTVVDSDFNFSDSTKLLNKQSDSSSTNISSSESISEPSLQKLADLPSDLNFLEESNSTSKSSSKSAPKKDLAATLFEIPPEFLQQIPQNLDRPSNTVDEDPSQLSTKEVSTQESDAESSSKSAPKKDLAATLFEIPPEFLQQIPQNLDRPANTVNEDLAKLSTKEVSTQDSNAGIEAEMSESVDVASESTNANDFLPKLLAELSWQKLLERAFKHQTDEIILTRSSDRNSIVANKNQLSQSSLEQVPQALFDSLVGEIRRIAKLPSKTLTSAKKIVLERFYEQERILVRLEFMPQTSDLEQLKIQILRDRALQVYEQQQMDRVSEQALQLAKQLEKTLRRIQVCFDSAELTNLKQLQAVQSQINHQLRLLDR